MTLPEMLDDLPKECDVGTKRNSSGMFKNTSLSDTTLTYAYFGNINRITGDDNPGGDVTSNSHIINIKNTSMEHVNAVVYAYLLNLEDLPAVSSSTYGIHVWGSPEVSDGIKVHYDGEWAFQSDYEDNPADYDANYYRLVLGAGFSGLTVKVGYEVLESDNDADDFATDTDKLIFTLQAGFSTA